MGPGQSQTPTSPLAMKYRHKLSNDQFNICYLNGDEIAYKNEYQNNFEEGLYVSAVSLKATGE